MAAILADTSAWIHARRAPGPGRTIFHTALLAGEVWTCGPVRLELLRGARNPHDLARLRAVLDTLPHAPVDERAWRRAESVLRDLGAVRGGRHRGPSTTDLLVAAVAAEHRLTVLHRDRDYDLIATVSDQPMQWAG